MKRISRFLVFLGVAAWACGSGPPKLQVSSLECRATTPADMRTVGRVTNISDEALRLTARVVILSANRPQWSEGEVRPSPLLPGQTGEFTVDTRGVPVGASTIECRLDWFADEELRRVEYIDADRATDQR